MFLQLCHEDRAKLAPVIPVPVSSPSSSVPGGCFWVGAKGVLGGGNLTDSFREVRIPVLYQLFRGGAGGFVSHRAFWNPAGSASPQGGAEICLLLGAWLGTVRWTGPLLAARHAVSLFLSRACRGWGAFFPRALMAVLPSLRCWNIKAGADKPLPSRDRAVGLIRWTVGRHCLRHSFHAGPFLKGSKWQASLRACFVFWRPAALFVKDLVSKRREARGLSESRSLSAF